MARAKSQKMPKPAGPPRRTARGFLQTGGILSKQIRNATEKRGFAETRLLTHWSDIAGEAVAGIARPIKIGYTRKGLGATLTLLTTGANAPMLQMQLPQIKERVNATYGYAAISRIHITQTAPDGFAEPQAPFEHDAPSKRAMSEQEKRTLEASLSDVSDSSLKSALAALGENVLTKSKT